jgi:hypothetical protein
VKSVYHTKSNQRIKKKKNSELRKQKEMWEFTTQNILKKKKKLIYFPTKPCQPNSKKRTQKENKASEASQTQNSLSIIEKSSPDNIPTELEEGEERWGSTQSDQLVRREQGVKSQEPKPHSFNSPRGQRSWQVGRAFNVQWWHPHSPMKNEVHRTIKAI